MDQLQTRLDALEQQMRTMNRRLHWWRGLAAGLLGLAVLTWALPSGTAQEDATAAGEQAKKGLEQRVAALETLLKHFSRKGNEVTIRGANAQHPAIRGGRRSHGLRATPARPPPTGGCLCGQDPQRRQARRLAGGAAHDLRAGHQPEDREGAWSDDPTDAPLPSG